MSYKAFITIYLKINIFIERTVFYLISLKFLLKEFNSTNTNIHSHTHTHTKSDAEQRKANFCYFKIIKKKKTFQIV